MAIRGRRILALLAVVLVAAGLVAAGLAVAAQIPLARPASALDDGLALTPPMGWNDWNAFGCGVSAQLVEQTALAMHDDGMQAAGYDYVNIDDCWAEPQRDANGLWVLTKPLAGGDRAVVLFNSTDAPAAMSTTAAQVGLGAAPSYTLSRSRCRPASRWWP
ncbi:MAG: alpha-galactosidase [Trebonia sp.]